MFAVTPAQNGMICALPSLSLTFCHHGVVVVVHPVLNTHNRLCLAPTVALPCQAGPCLAIISGRASLDSIFSLGELGPSAMFRSWMARDGGVQSHD